MPFHELVGHEYFFIAKLRDKNSLPSYTHSWLRSIFAKNNFKLAVLYAPDC